MQKTNPDTLLFAPSIYHVSSDKAITVILLQMTRGNNPIFYYGVIVPELTCAFCWFSYMYSSASSEDNYKCSQITVQLVV